MILIYGATGLMGQLVAETLVAKDQPLVLAGRDPVRLSCVARDLPGHLETREAHIHSAQELSQALEGASLVINCAGPFLPIGEHLLKAAIEKGVHYLDISGEQRFMREMYERHESRARKSGVTVVNGMAFDVAIGDWAVALAAETLGTDTPENPLDEIAVAYATDKFRPSAGTQRSVLAQLENPGDIWAEDRWEPLEPTGDVRSFSFPEPFGTLETVSFPSGEVISAPRHTHAKRVVTYLALAGNAPLARWVTRAAAALTPALPALLRSPVGAFARANIEATRSRMTEEERSENHFAVLAVARRGQQVARVAVTGKDIYRLSADIVSEAACDILSDGAPAGVLTPAELFNAEDSLGDLVKRGLIEVLSS